MLDTLEMLARAAFLMAPIAGLLGLLHILVIPAKKGE